METLADLTPENVRKSTTDDAAERAGRARPVTPQEQEDWDARVAEVEERRSGRTTIAPLVVAGIAVAGVVGLIVWFTASSGGPVVVDTMPTPVIAADRAGEAVYPADSAEAVRENVRFGFAPAVELVELGDGTVVLGTGGPDDGEDVFGAPYESSLRSSSPRPRSRPRARTHPRAHPSPGRTRSRTTARTRSSCPLSTRPANSTRSSRLPQVRAPDATTDGTRSSSARQTRTSSSRQ